MLERVPILGTLYECVMDKIYLNDENGVPIPVKATQHIDTHTHKDEPYQTAKKTREMSCGYSTRYKLKHIVISNNIFLEFIFYFYCFHSSVFFCRQGLHRLIFLLTF